MKFTIRPCSTDPEVHFERTVTNEVDAAKDFARLVGLVAFNFKREVYKDGSEAVRFTIGTDREFYCFRSQE